jgi:hypothetical protein
MDLLDKIILRCKAPKVPYEKSPIRYLAGLDLA